MTSGAGIYFDGQTSVRQDVVVRLGASGLEIAGHDGNLLAHWPYDQVEGLAAPDSVLRLGRRDSTTLERLEIADPQFAAAIDVRALHVDRTGLRQRRARLRLSISMGLSVCLGCERGLLGARFRGRQGAAGLGRAALEQRKDIHWSTSQRIGRSGVIPAGREVRKDS